MSLLIGIVVKLHCATDIICKQKQSDVLKSSVKSTPVSKVGVGIYIFFSFTGSSSTRHSFIRGLPRYFPGPAVPTPPRPAVRAQLTPTRRSGRLCVLAQSVKLAQGLPVFRVNLRSVPSSVAKLHVPHTPCQSGGSVPLIWSATVCDLWPCKLASIRCLLHLYNVQFCRSRSSVKRSSSTKLDSTCVPFSATTVSFICNSCSFPVVTACVFLLSDTSPHASISNDAKL